MARYALLIRAASYACWMAELRYVAKHGDPTVQSRQTPQIFHSNANIHDDAAVVMGHTFNHGESWTLGPIWFAVASEMAYSMLIHTR